MYTYNFFTDNSSNTSHAGAGAKTGLAVSHREDVHTKVFNFQVFIFGPVTESHYTCTKVVHDLLILSIHKFKNKID
jgi:hypothetical protein